MHHSHGVAVVHHRGDLAAEVGSCALGVMALGDDPVEELATGAELHDKIDRMSILVGSLELDNVAVPGEVVHDLHLAADVIQVVSVDEFARGNGFAR